MLQSWLVAALLLFSIIFTVLHFFRLIKQGEDPPACRKCELKELQKLQQNGVGFAGRKTVISGKKR